MAENAAHIITSDIPGAIASAERLAPKRELVVSAMLRETMLSVPHWPTRLSAFGWETLAHLG